MDWKEIDFGATAMNGTISISIAGVGVKNDNNL